VHPHHKEAVEQLVEYFRPKEGVIGIILSGSVARGSARKDSDIDGIVVLDSRAYGNAKRKGIVAECIFGICDYPGGYFDIKYFPKDYLVNAAAIGSEPTRNSFVGAKTLYATDQEISTLTAKIGRYPSHEKTERIRSFYAAYALNSGYFWKEAQRSGDSYLRLRTASDIALFGSRLLLAHKETLFPCQKWLLPTIRSLKEQPEGFAQLLDEFATKPCQHTKDRFCESVESICDWPRKAGDHTSVLSRFIADNEQWWWKRRPTLAEW